MKVFITGASGFIGGHIVRKLLNRGFQVNALVRKSSNLLGLKDLSLNIFNGDLLDKDSIYSAMKGCKACFHVAAMYTFWEKDKQDFYNNNVLGTKNVLDCAIDLAIEKIVYTSSESTVKLEFLPKNSETMSKNYDKLNDISNVASEYKKTKILAEIEVKKYINLGLPIIIIAPTTPIGSWDIKPTPTGKIVLDYLKGKMPAYVNTGLNIIDVEDVAEGHVLALKNGIIGKKYILGNKNLTLKEIFKILENITNIPAPKIQIPLWIAYFAGLVDEFVSSKILKKCPSIPVAAVKSASKFRFFDCSDSVKSLGLKLSPVEEAFRKAVEWFKNYNYC